MLKVNSRVQLQALIDFFNRIGASFENVMDVVTTVRLTRIIVGKLLSSDLLDFIELCALFLHLTSDCAHKIINASLTPLGVQDDRPLVFAIHLPVFVRDWFSLS